MIKQSIFRVARSRMFSSLVTMLEKLEHHQNLLRVLTYHRVDDCANRPQLDPSLISATPGQFAQQMEHLAEHYCVVTVEQVLAAVNGQAPLPPKSVLITFDDAYRDFAEHAWPTLKQLGLPAVMFVPTAFPDQPRQFWWDSVYQAVLQGDPLQVLATLELASVANETRPQTARRVARWLKSKDHDELLARVARLAPNCGTSAPESPVMNWDQLIALSDQGLTLGAHTQTHPLLNRVPVDVAVAEASESLRALQSRVPDVPRVFAYPGGAFSEEVVEQLRDVFDLAFTTCRGINDLEQTDRLRLRRINVSRHTPTSLVRAQMLAGVRHLNRQWPLESAV